MKKKLKMKKKMTFKNHAYPLKKKRKKKSTLLSIVRMT